MTNFPDIQFPTVGNGTFLEHDGRIYPQELQLALRNKAIPLEGLGYDITPVGMHYTLIHYDIPHVDPNAWRLSVNEGFTHPLTLDLASLRTRTGASQVVTIECAGDGRGLTHPRSISQPWLTGAVGTAEWTGVPLRSVLEEAQPESGSVEILFRGLDSGFEGGLFQDYERSLPLDVAMHPATLLAWEMNGRALEPQHGFPLRLVVPGWYGMAHVKWLAAIEALDRPYEGYQQEVAYRFSQSRDDPGQPVDLMRVRSLMIPPGVPDYLTRTRVVSSGKVRLAGRAWAGRAAIEVVDVSADGGSSWLQAKVEKPLGEFAWQAWSYTWDASPGKYELVCRATDTEGNRQPLDQYWTARGMGNNAVHRVFVIVADLS